MREFELIKQIAARAPSDSSLIVGIGDDAAVFRGRGNCVTAVDAFVEGVHFNRDWASLHQIGWKAVTASMSDLAAMGVGAAQVLIAAGLSVELDDQQLLELFEGALAATSAADAVLCGGDTVASPTLWLSVSVIGWAADQEAVTRGSAKAGDHVVVTGDIGASRAGFELLKQPQVGMEIDQATTDRLVRRHLEPVARLMEGQALANFVTSMVDISDGFAADLEHTLEASNVGATINGAVLPIDPGTAAVAQALGTDPIEFAANGGEDYELIATMGPDMFAAATDALAEFGTALNAVGKVTAQQGLTLLDRDGQPLEISGFEHLS